MTGSNAAQIEYWNGRAGEKWARTAGSRGRDAIALHRGAKGTGATGSGRRVLDIGCGTGETCAIWLDGGATVTGLDVSGPMLAVAAARTGGKATLVKADASVWIGDAPFDLAVSRFGVMFFDDPDAAFANIAANLRPGGRLVFACWRPVEENSWVTTPMALFEICSPKLRRPGRTSRAVCPCRQGSPGWNPRTRRVSGCRDRSLRFPGFARQRRWRGGGGRLRDPDRPGVPGARRGKHRDPVDSIGET